MNENRDIRFFPVFLGATLGVLLEIIATLIDEIITGNLFSDEVFASVNLITPYTLFEVFVAYLVTVAAAALIVRARGADDRERMSALFSQTIIVCRLVGAALTLIYVVFTPQLVRLVADDPAVYDNALAYLRAMRFYPLLDVFDTFMFAYVLYQGGYVHFYIAILSRIGINAGLLWVLGSRMGVMGIGLASFMFNAVSMLILLTHFRKKSNSLRWNLHFSLDILKQVRPEGVQIISKDDGVLFDISEADVSVTSIAAFVVSNYMEKLGEDKRHLTTMSFNRSAFLIQTAAN